MRLPISYETSRFVSDIAYFGHSSLILMRLPISYETSRFVTEMSYFYRISLILMRLTVFQMKQVDFYQLLNISIIDL